MKISDTIAQLKAAKAGISPQADHLARLTRFGSNPGDLEAFYYLPESKVGPLPLVVVLHGCTQSAASYDHGSGWSALAERNGFAVLFPQQTRSNNANLCFNWFEPGDTVRGRGEAASIHQMIMAMIEEHGADPEQVFVTGLSAGGAMTSVMLATYPETFKAGAVIAGVSYGCATGVGQAFECMSGRGTSSAKVLGDRVRKASKHDGPWPRVSVWHGSSDRTVAASNGDDVVKQWLSVHGLSAAPDRTGQVEGYPYSAWKGTDGKIAVEQYVITGMGHGTPLAPGQGQGQSGAAGPHMLDASISSTDRIAAFFGIASSAADVPKAAVRAKAKPATSKPAGVQQVIEDALRKAGLMSS